MQFVHTPVMKDECLSWLSSDKLEGDDPYIMIDSTLGEGGHAEAFLQAYPRVQIVGVDADEAIQRRARERLSGFGQRMRFYSGWFNEFYANYPADLPHPRVILFDLGISLFHYGLSGRGFSFRSEEPLDMRLSGKGPTAADLVNSLTKEALADLFFSLGEERYSRRIAQAISEYRSHRHIGYAGELADIVYNSVPAAYAHGRLHPATRVFQALRIAVNQELDRLAETLPAAFRILENGGLMGIISFHSLEDRTVKQFFKAMGKHCTCPANQAVCSCGGKPCADILTRKPVTAQAAEIRSNQPSRSAKLRVIRKLSDAPSARLDPHTWIEKNCPSLQRRNTD